jgi:dienelactone hydrolase
VTSLLFLAGAALAADAPGRILLPGQKPDDSRLGKAKTLNDYFPFSPPDSREAWEKRRQEVREQVLVATGLWPLPEKTPLDVVIHGKIDRDDYTIEKVFFESYPGHYVSGNLYRPKGRSGKLPAILSPHGHWANGRFYEAPEKEVAAQMKPPASGGPPAETTVEGARYPLQARCAQLARMGCVVFHYDMVGNADSQPIAHRQGFTDAQAELRGQSFMGLQTWNSIRALDFLTSLPDVDPRRVGVTGASGGGTQTFMLCAVDDRPAVAFPAVMVSTAMQGGCICENCSYLRVDTGNIELAGLFAPKPLGMSGAKDWTVDIERKGLPELKALYKLHGAEDKVMAKCYDQFGHNYNQVSRELMYNWFNKHLGLGLPEPVVEKPFVPVPPRELSVYNEEHPRPKDVLDAAALRRQLALASDRQLAALRPKDADSLAEARRIHGTALRVMIGDKLPPSDQVEAKETGPKQERNGLIWRTYLLGRKGLHQQIPAIGLMGKEFDGTVVVWVHPEGKSSLFKDSKLVPAAQKIVDKKAAIFAPDVYLSGESAGDNPHPVDKNFAGYTFGYNRTTLAERVRDILTSIAFVKGHEKTKAVDLAGFDKAGPWALLAGALAGPAVARTAVDAHQFDFASITKTDDEMLLPGAVKYGGLPALAGLCAPGELFMHNTVRFRGKGDTDLKTNWTSACYQAAGKAENLVESHEKAEDEKVIAWLLR